MKIPKFIKKIWMRRLSNAEKVTLYWAMRGHYYGEVRPDTPLLTVREFKRLRERDELYS